MWEEPRTHGRIYSHLNKLVSTCEPLSSKHHADKRSYPQWDVIVVQNKSSENTKKRDKNPTPSYWHGKHSNYYILYWNTRWLDASGNQNNTMTMATLINRNTSTTNVIEVKIRELKTDRFRYQRILSIERGTKIQTYSQICDATT